MRSDYALYGLAAIFFIITIVSYAGLAGLERNVSVVATAVLGMLSFGLGFALRPRPKPIVIQTVTPPPTPPPPPPAVEVSQPTTIDVVVQEQPIVSVEPSPQVTIPKAELTEVNGIGVKRAEQLKNLGINSVDDLARASAEDLAAKLKISAKVTRKWTESAKQLAEKS